MVSPTDQENNEIEVSNDADGSTAEAPTANGADEAETPAADDKGSTESLADKIQKAVSKANEEEAPVLEGDKGSDPAAAPTGTVVEEDQPFTKDDLPGLHSKTRKRVGKLIEKLETTSKELDAEKPVADNYRNLISFLKENDVEMEDANNAFQILADINRNPEAALAALEPVVENLRKIAGAVLPDDLANEVRQGYITEDRAKEIAKLRAKSTLTEVQQTRTQERSQTSQEQAARQTALDITDAISGWESKWASSDPDYSKKRSDVQDEIELALGRAAKTKTLPKTPAEAVKFAEDCKKRVESKLTRFQPRKQEIRHVTGSVANTAKPQPKTLAEAIQQGVNG